MPEPARSAAQIEWEYAQAVQRSSTLVTGLCAALGMTHDEMNALFVEAARL
jgi:hypothetical protein